MVYLVREKILGFKRGSRKEEWISMEAWKAIDERKLLKSKMDQRRIGWNSQQEKTREYREKDKEVKKRCREDRNKYILEETEEAEEAAVSGDSKTLFHIVKELAGKTKVQTLPIKKSNGQNNHKNA